MENVICVFLKHSCCVHVHLHLATFTHCLSVDAQLCVDVPETKFVFPLHSVMNRLTSHCVGKFQCCCVSWWSGLESVNVSVYVYIILYVCVCVYMSIQVCLWHTVDSYINVLGQVSVGLSIIGLLEFVFC